jgi:SAM-dependent methyltransferase
VSAVIVLDIGCGKKKQEADAIGLDRQPGSAADIRAELANFPWPLCDSCADRIYVSHFLEHQPDILRAMAEVHRIGKPGAEVIVTTPHYSSPDSYADPTHLFHLGFHSFEYFVGDTFENFNYGCGGFRIIERRLTFGGNLFFDGIARFWARISVDFYEKHVAWVFPARNLVCRLAIVK